MLDRVTYEFVESVPDDVLDGVVYISFEYDTMIHRCCCGCGREVVTPLSPAGWRVTYDGESISVHPSIGNWGFPCQSHYWIRHNMIEWSTRWTPKQIAAGRAADEAANAALLGGRTAGVETIAPSPRTSVLQWFKRKLFGS